MTRTDEVVSLPSVGLTTPTRVSGIKPYSVANLCLISGHGLGSDNPKNKTHLLDNWITLMKTGSALTKQTVTSISYTARGHGNSQGWEETAESNPLQFTWGKLSSDMIALADYYELPTFVASGSSMGSGR
jgi:hypothetical protein